MKVIITIDDEVLENRESVFSLGEQIHNQLKGNQDYIDSNIILNCDSKNDEDEGDIYLTAYLKDSKDKRDLLSKFQEAIDVAKNHYIK